MIISVFYIKKHDMMYQCYINICHTIHQIIVYK